MAAHHVRSVGTCSWLISHTVHSMMHDSVIANLHAADLRAVVRGLLAVGPADNTTLFVRLAKERLSATRSDDLSPPQVCRHARCLFAVGLVDAALGLLADRVIPHLDALSAEDWLKLDHDIVQAVQSSKESGFAEAPSIGILLHALQSARDKAGSAFPLQRGLLAVETLTGTTSRAERPGPVANVHVPVTQLPTVTLGPLECPRLFLGLWQLSSPNWGSASEANIHAALSESALRGFTAFDMADHYGTSEPLIFNTSSHRVCRRRGGAICKPSLDNPSSDLTHCQGHFRRNVARSQSVVSATKWCVFKPIEITRESVEAAITERLTRLQVDSVDLLQFHWQNVNLP